MTELELQAMADGKLVCKCGNRDWRGFVYMGDESRVTAFCKKCGAGYDAVLPAFFAALQELAERHGGRA